MPVLERQPLPASRNGSKSHLVDDGLRLNAKFKRVYGHEIGYVPLPEREDPVISEVPELALPTPRDTLDTLGRSSLEQPPERSRLAAKLSLGAAALRRSVAELIIPARAPLHRDSGVSGMKRGLVLPSQGRHKHLPGRHRQIVGRHKA